MRIGIDARFATRPPRRGIGNYSLSLIREICLIDPSVQFFLYIDYPDTEAVLPAASNVHVRLVRFLPYPIWEQIALPILAALDGIDVLHCPGNTAPLLLPRRAKLVLSLLDVMFLKSETIIPKPVTRYQKLGRWYRSLISPPAARNARSIITTSNFSKQDILNSIAGLQPGKIAVIHLACDDAFSKELPKASSQARADALESAPGSFILCLGAHDPRKNTLNVVRAYLRNLRLGNVVQDLMVVGYANWQQSTAFKEVVAANSVARVKFKEFVSTAELVSLFRRARFFVYASLYEGFGIPVLEALTVSCPTITSNVTSMPEVGGDAVLYVNPSSEEEIAAAMLQLCTDDGLCRSLALKGVERAREFNWAQIAGQTLAAYKACYEQAGV